MSALSQPIHTAPWIEVKDGHPEARAIFGRHYSYRRSRDQISLFPSRNRNYKLFAGPGTKLVLLAACARALFIWRKFKSGDGQKGVNCAAFRNEGAGLASELIRIADSIAWDKWPGERHYTYVDDKRVKSRNPGYCFLMAGWSFVRNPDGTRYRTKHHHLLLLERLPGGEV